MPGRQVPGSTAWQHAALLHPALSRRGGRDQGRMERNGGSDVWLDDRPAPGLLRREHPKAEAASSSRPLTGTVTARAAHHIHVLARIHGEA